MITLQNPHGTVTLSPYGGQVMTYTPTGGTDVFWQTSDELLANARAAGKALRGGVPVCWPWFSTFGTPQHGTARLNVWNILQTAPSGAVLAFAEGSLSARLEVTLTEALTVALTTTNNGDKPVRLTQALHTYLRVGDVAKAQVSGLENLTNCRVTGRVPQAVHSTPLAFHGEVESLYSNTPPTLTLTDSSLGRRIVITHSGCTEAVAWNPGPEKAAGMDIPPGGWQQFVCLEAANADTAPTLQPGSSHTLTARYEVLKP